MKKTFMLFISIVTALFSVACSSVTPVVQNIPGTVSDIGNINVLVPEGWAIEPGLPGGYESDDSVFLRPYENSDEYIWIQIMTEEDKNSAVKVNTTEKISAINLTNGKWKGKESLISSTIDNKTFAVSNNGIDFNDDTVIAILNSIKPVGQATE